MEGNHEHTAHAPPGDRRLGTLRLANYVEYWWPRGENWGICNCRTVHGSSSLSLHAGGRAYDHHLSVHDAKDKAAGGLDRGGVPSC